MIIGVCEQLNSVVDLEVGFLRIVHRYICWMFITKKTKKERCGQVDDLVNGFVVTGEAAEKTETSLHAYSSPGLPNLRSFYMSFCENRN